MNDIVVYCCCSLPKVMTEALSAISSTSEQRERGKSHHVLTHKGEPFREATLISALPVRAALYSMGTDREPRLDEAM